MINKQILILITLCSLCFVGCGSNKTEKQSISKETNESILYVHEKIVPCKGEGIDQCLLTKENPSDKWSYCYDGIQGFNYEEGYRYKIKVYIKMLKGSEIMADGSDRVYILVKILEKTLIENGVEYK